MKSKYTILTALLVLVLSILACGSPKPTPTQTVEPTEPPVVDEVTGKLEISQTYGFQDSYGDTYVVGEVVNNTDSAVTNIELSIEIKDAAGNSLLKDENDAIVPTLAFYPMLNTIAPGESTPFSYPLDADAGTPDTYTVTIEGFDTTTVERGQISTENVYVYNDGEGTLYMSGELVNTSNSWTYINSFAAGMMDSSGKLVTADWTFTYAADLAPAGDPDGFDRTPFAMSLTAPDVAVDQWVTYVDAETIEQPAQYDLDVNLTYNYFDEYGDFHIVGTLANNSDKYLAVRLVAGLYDGSDAVIDADYMTMPVVLRPGDTDIPFDVSYFSSVNWNDEVASALERFTVQVDWYSTYEPYYSVVDLESAGDDYTQEGSTLTFTGTVTNTSGQDLSGATVVIFISDKNGNLVATESTYLVPEGDTFAPNATLTYELTLYADPSLTINEDYTWYSYVQGDVK